MPLHIIREDISRMAVDAIVAAGSARPDMPMPTGGVNGSIHKRAGERLLAALRRLGGIRAGGVTLTKGYDLPCKYVIHTAGPVWRGGSDGEEKLLYSCYEKALKLAGKEGFASIAFPLISTGRYGYPKAQAMQVATRAIRAFLDEHDMDVYLVVYDLDAFQISGELFTDVEAFIDQHYVEAHYTARTQREEDWLLQRMPAPMYGDCEAVSSEGADWDTGVDWDTAPEPVRDAPRAAAAAPEALIPPGLERRLQQLDEGFSGMLLRLIDERGMKDSACYRRANVDRKLFNKIKNNPGYQPKKSTVAAFCVALKLNINATRDLLARAGYGLSRSNMFDVIVEYFILKGVWDVDVINQVLFAYDQPLLGSNVG